MRYSPGTQKTQPISLTWKFTVVCRKSNTIMPNNLSQSTMMIHSSISCFSCFSLSASPKTYPQTSSQVWAVERTERDERLRGKWGQDIHAQGCHLQSHCFIVGWQHPSAVSSLPYVLMAISFLCPFGPRGEWHSYVTNPEYPAINSLWVTC